MAGTILRMDLKKITVISTEAKVKFVRAKTYVRARYISLR